MILFDNDGSQDCSALDDFLGWLFGIHTIQCAED
jgi:hypothetical protein